MIAISQSSHSSIQKRRVFFSFHYQDDIWRADQIRNSWRVGEWIGEKEHKDFFDASIWEDSQRTLPESLKDLIRGGIENTSVTCVLVGAKTFERRWVRYEIARSLIKGNGIFSVRINAMQDQFKNTSKAGSNPLDLMGVYNKNGRILLIEKCSGKWGYYRDYTQSINLPSTFSAPSCGESRRLSHYYKKIYCYKKDGGYRNFSDWARKAAADVGR